MRIENEINWRRRRLLFLINSGFKCAECGDDRNLVVHHKDYNKKNCDEKNLIVLCRKCHNRIHNRRRWIRK